MRALLLALVLLAPLALAGGTATHEILIVGGGSAATFAPVVIVIQRGESLAWTNTDVLDVPHLVAGSNGEGAFDTGILRTGDTSEAFTFERAGTFFYHCPLHGTMREGWIVVV